ncbi:phospholipase D-like domain-containing protein [Salipaludibacillus sp. CUR1]|uniref:phospholipase D-like domain-containing protein n=1 Tax=Salipaludibacillus sp. CUR1 TaxID=2820003 RepID=UPI001E4FE5C9|nr:phospholipase D-like domain-containing protein [Salipaludibacillus sp. CUR1]MCE7791287.1 phospholipase D-like domain-containing protein [Salipaludibacillus sp. CUR1]
MSIQRIPLVPGKIELVSSKDELNYQDVINDFSEADFIFVTTYNISERRGDLLQMLKDATEHAEVRIVTNIPSRFDRYYGSRPREKAEASIEKYTERLNPEMEDRLATFFHFENHTKIILTNNIAYVGSANFSEESQRSRETGILIRDPNMVQLVVDNLVPILEGEGKQYFGDILNEKQLTLSLFLSEIKMAADRIREGLYTYVGHPIENTEVYNFWAPTLSEEDVSMLLDVIIELEEEVTNLSQIHGLNHTSKLLDLSLLQKVKGLCEYRTSIRELSQFNEQDLASNLLTDELALYDDLDEACQLASQQASDQHRDLAEDAEEDIRQLLSLLDSIKDQVVQINTELNRLDDKQGSIDNT